MNSNRIKVKISGVLLIFGMIAGILSVSPAVDAPDYLIKAAENTTQVIIRAIFQFIMSIAYVGFAVLFYPILKKYSDSLALGFLSFRIVAATLIIIGTILLLLILALSLEFTNSVQQDLSHFQVMGNLLQTGRDLVNHVFMILALSFSGLILYFMLFKARLVPYWLSLWGILGTLLTITASLFVLFGSIEIITPAYMILNIPLVLFELILAIWLIFKGIKNNT